MLLFTIGELAGQDLSSSINYGNPRQYEIAAIDVDGNVFLDETALVSLSGLRVGDNIKVPGAEISGAIKKLWKQGIIGNVEVFANKIEGNKIWLTIKLTERPRLSRFVFEGVGKAQVSELEDKVGLVKGKVLTDAVSKNAEIAVKKYYVAKGFLNVAVNLEQVKDTILSNSVILKVNVKKGKKVKIDRIHFNGDENFASGKLRSQLKNTGEAPRFHIVNDLMARTLRLFKPGTARNFFTKENKLEKKDLQQYISDQVNINFFKSIFS